MVEIIQAFRHQIITLMPIICRRCLFQKLENIQDRRGGYISDIHGVNFLVNYKNHIYLHIRIYMQPYLWEHPVHWLRLAPFVLLLSPSNVYFNVIHKIITILTWLPSGLHFSWIFRQGVKTSIRITIAYSKQLRRWIIWFVKTRKKIEKERTV